MNSKTYRVLTSHQPGCRTIFASPLSSADEVGFWTSMDGVGETVYLAATWVPGIVRVFFENGPVPGSGEWHYEMQRREAIRRHEEEIRRQQESQQESEVNALLLGD